MLNENELKEQIIKVEKWIKEYVEKCGANGVVIGNSGGKDSAVVIALATKALGQDKILTVAMPCSSKITDLDDAKLVASTFSVPFLEIDLLQTYNSLENFIQTELKSININQLSKEATINVKPRLRMTTLYAIAQTLGYLVIGTGNLCERFVGYTTKWGDGAADFNPIGEFTVSEVIQIGKILGIPERIYNKPPSDGIDGRTDEQKMGVKYIQIEEYIEKNKTDEIAQEKIKKMHNASKHKRESIPIYKVER